MENDVIFEVKYIVKYFVEYFIGDKGDSALLHKSVYDTHIKKNINKLKERGKNDDEIKSMISDEITKRHDHGKIYNVETTVDNVISNISGHIVNPDLLPEKAIVKFPLKRVEPLIPYKHKVKIQPNIGFAMDATFIKEKLKPKKNDKREDFASNTSDTFLYVFEVNKILGKGKKNIEIEQGYVTFIYDEKPVAIEEQSPIQGGKRRKRSTKRKTKRKTKKSKRKSKKSKTIRKRH